MSESPTRPPLDVRPLLPNTAPEVQPADLVTIERSDLATLFGMIDRSSITAAAAQDGSRSVTDELISIAGVMRRIREAILSG